MREFDENEAAAAAILSESFMDVDFLEFGGRELNTSPSRFDLVTRWALPELSRVGNSAISVYPVAKKTVFVCQLELSDFRRLKRDEDALEEEFEEWNDKNRLVPSNKQAMESLIDASNAVWESWNGSGGEPENADLEEDLPGKTDRR